MMKSCSTMNAVFLECRMYRLITLAARIRCSESRYAEGSSRRYISAGLPSDRANATLCSSPPERFLTCRSMISSILSGRITSDTNWG
mmetsp:Transcript_32222/g.44946  ORF Transcript_32222/g.44946 Transcript_32222/m.44946 type:complete len:87 (+) Transcript_32222:500-760(+)